MSEMTRVKISKMKLIYEERTMYVKAEGKVE